MSRIFDNIQQRLIEALRATLQVSNRADFCVGYLNLRGWQAIDDLIQPWQPEQSQVCRVLVGMQRLPHEEVRELYRTAASDTPAVPRAENHHDLVAEGLKLVVHQDKTIGGGLGRPSSPRRRAYERLKAYAEAQRNTLFRDEELERALDDVYARPLLETAADLLNRLMRGGVNDEELAGAVKTLREEGRLTYAEEDAQLREPRVVCSLGLIAGS